MANIEKIKTDISKETDGAWVPFVLGIELKIARAGNPKYKECIRKLVVPVTDSIRDESLTKDEFVDILIKARAKTILLDWKNLDDKDGNPIPYSAAKAEEFFRDPELQDFYKFVVATSESSADFKKALIEDAEKNL